MSALPERLAADRPPPAAYPGRRGCRCGGIRRPPAAALVRSFPSETVSAARRRGEPGREHGPPSAVGCWRPRQLQELETLPRGPAARAGDGGHRGRGRGAREVQRLHVPAVRPDVRGIQAGAGQATPRSIPGKLKFVTTRLSRWIPSATASCRAAATWRRAKPRWRCAWRARRARPTQMENWLFANQPTLTPTSVKEAARMIGGVHRFRRPLRRHAAAREGRHRAGRSAAGAGHADLLPERHPSARPARRSSSTPPSPWR